jgi:uncharacterized protein YjbI with pentapeptide repeats
MSWRFLIHLALLLAATGAGIGEGLASALTQIPASEILSRMADGQPVHCEGVSITGDLLLCTLPGARLESSLELINCTVSNGSFDGTTLEKDVVLWGTSFGNVSFDKSRFLGRADLSNTVFHNASFTGASFDQPVSFDGAFFLDNVSFEDAQFDKDASFNWAWFEKGADFNYSRFGYYTYFSGAQFLGEARFSSVEFQGVLDFSNAIFADKANFFGSTFESAASFTNASFSGQAQFALTRFGGLSSFGEALFGNEANFELARFADAAYFSGAKFRGDAIFGLTKFEDIVSFQGATFQGDLNFKGGKISTLLLDEGDCKDDCRIILNDTDFNRLRVPWREIEDHVVWDPGAYLALVDNYHRLGWPGDEDDCYYQYRSMNQAHAGWGWSKAIDVLAWLSCGYGVRPGYAVAWALLTILIFAILFWRGDGIRRSAKPLQGPAEKDSIPERVTFRNALFFSTMVFLSQGPIDFLPVGRHRYYVILEGIMGWLLLALFLVTLGRVMIR